jgi:TonB family protein
MLQATPTRAIVTTSVGPVHEDKQRRRLVIAIVLLLAAIAAVLVRDRQSWFGTDNDEAAVADGQQPVFTPSLAVPAPQAPAAEAKMPVAAKHSAEPASRGTHSTHARSTATLASNPVKRESPRVLESATARASEEWGPASPATERVRSSDQVQIHQQPESYPLLTQATAVQGSVLLQALIRADGTVEELRVISGPTILVSAARQAVQQWRFKPYLLNGKPVETSARVSVNFTINVSNTEARYHVDSVTSSGSL